MVAHDYILWLIPETIKYLIISSFLIGMTKRAGYKKYIVFAYAVLGMILAYAFKYDSVIYETVWGVVLIAGFYDGKISKKIQIFL